VDERLTVIGSVYDMMMVGRFVIKGDSVISSVMTLSIVDLASCQHFVFGLLMVEMYSMMM
jgi:hypothetical protein